MSSVIEARAALERAEAAEKAERRDKLTDQLAEVHNARVKAEREYLEIAGRIKRERELRTQYRFQISHVDNLLAQHAKLRPAVADYLPSDKDVFVWTMRQGRLEHDRAKLVELLRNVPETSTIEAIRYEGVTGIITTLQMAENNLLNALDPTGRDAWLRGGVFPVSDM